MPRSSTGFWGHKGCAFSRVQSPALGTQTPPAPYGEGQVTQKEMQKKGHRLEICGNGSQGTSQSFQLLSLAALPSCFLTSWPGGGEEGHFADPLTGDWHGGCSPHVSQSWGLKVAASMVFQLHAMAWQDLPLRSFFKGVDSRKETIICSCSERINLHLGRG